MRKTHLKTAKTLIILFALGCGDFEMLEADGAASPDESEISTQEKSSSDPSLSNRSLLPRERKVMDGKRFGASSWDGRLFFGIRYDRANPGFINYTVSVFRPEVLQHADDIRGFTDAFSDVTLMAHHAGPTVRLTHQAVFKDPRFPMNPFRSNSKGQPTPNGDFETYKLGHLGVGNRGIDGKNLALSASTVTIRNPRSEDAAVEFAQVDAGPWDLRTTEGDLLNHYEPSASPDGRLMIWHGRVNNEGPAGVIAASFNPNPMNPDGWLPVRSLVDLYYTLGPGSPNERMVDGVPFSKRYPIAAEPMRGPDGAILPPGTYIPGAYPWLSFDASEAFFPTVKAFDGPRRSAMSAIGQRTGYALTHLDGLINPTRGDVMSRSIDRSPVRFPDLHPEGRFLRTFYNQQKVGSTDEPLSRGAYHRLFVVPLTLTESMWSPVNREATPATGQLARMLTKMQHGGVLGTFLSHSMRYVEVDLSPAEDGHYLLFSPMHENLALNMGKLRELHATTDKPRWRLDREAISHDLKHSVDMSGHFNRVRLRGAKFPYEYHRTKARWQAWWNRVPPNIRDASAMAGHPRCDRPDARCIEPGLIQDYLAEGDANARGVEALSGDRIYGRYGNAIYFPPGATVEVNFTESAQSAMATATGMSLSFWLRPLVSLDQELLEFGRLTIKAKRGRIRAESNAFGRLVSDNVLRRDAWTHVALRMNRSTAELWINGEKVASRRSRWTPSIVNSLRVGERRGGRGERTQARFVVDELRLSDVFRSAVEIGDAAFINKRAQPSGVNELNLDVYLPNNARQWDAVQRQRITNLGRDLFFSKKLSVNDRVSCSSCHQPGKAFTDGRRLAVGVHGHVGDHNTPVIFNRDASTRQFADGRASSLEAQVKHPFDSHDELGLPLNEAVKKLRTDFGPAFRAAFGRQINAGDLALALASFQRSLISAESRYDRRQLTPKELRGEALFFGKARCSSCHAGPNFTDEMFHHIALGNGAMGRAAVTKRAGDAGRLKTPTLRDIALTAPYFRDGSKQTLEAVVDHYNTAGMNSAASDFELHPIGLKRAEKSDLVAFLKTLTGSTLPMNRRGTPVGNLQLVAGGGTNAIWLVGLGFSADTIVQIARRETDAPFMSLRGRSLNIAHGVTPTGWSGAWDRITFSKPARLRSMNQFWVSIESNGRRTSPRLIKLRRE